MKPDISAARSRDFFNIAPALSATCLQEGQSFESSAVMSPCTKRSSEVYEKKMFPRWFSREHSSHKSML